MAGFDVGIINIIADNLRDRYKSNFQVLKEIIQNADDAASQTAKGVQLDFGFTEGLADAEHPLLRGPALFFLNNGSFSEQDARAVKSFGLNSKAADNTSIGKFGLGMKSVFHFCEAFFWLAQDGDLRKEEILNPWSGSKEYPSPQTAWDDFQKKDATRIKEHLKGIGNNLGKTPESYFLLWLPLRQQRHLLIEGEEVGSIISEFPGDDLKKLDFLFQPSLAKELAELLPLLRHLSCIQCWKTDGTHSLQLEYSIQIREGGSRNTYPNTKKISSLSGAVTYSQKNEITKSHVLQFAGFEGRAGEVKLKELRESDRWPKSYVRDAQGRERPQPDKAKGHCAVTFTRSSEKTNGRLDIQWAVFLPLDTGRESCFCNSSYSYNLTLHGFFFVDAGRLTIEGFGTEEQNISFPPETENELRTAWNYYLLTRGTLLLVIPSLGNFIKQSNIGAEEVRNLCTALVNSTLFKKYRKYICQLSQWVRKIDTSGVQWVEIKSAQKILPLPPPPQKDPNRPWDTFLHLSDLEKEYIYVQKNEPHLTLKPVPQWDEISLQTVLDFDSVKVFSSQSYINYLKLFLQDDSVSPFLKISPLQKQLIGKIRKAFLYLGQDLSQVTTGIQDIVSFVIAENRYILKTNAHGVIRDLQKVDSDFLILHKDFDFPGLPGTAKLTEDEATQFLGSLDQQLRNYEAKGKGHLAEQCREVILEILKSLDRDTRRNVLLRGKMLKIITAYDCQLQKNSSFTVEDLEDYQNRASLFLYTQGVNLTERLGLSIKLQAVLAKDKIVLLTSETATIVFGTLEHGIKQCLAEGCLEALGQVCRTLTNENARAELVGAVSGVDLKNIGAISIHGFRYLLHGDEELFQGSSTLWVQRYQQNQVWSKLWEQLVGYTENNVLVPRSLAEKIPQDERWQVLRLREIDQQGILDDIREKGIEFIKPTSFSEEERTEVLLAAQRDRELWQSLPLHETLSGEFVSITNSTYSQPSVEIPDVITDIISVIKESPDLSLCRLQRDPNYIQPLTDAILITSILAFPESYKYSHFILDTLARIKNTMSTDLISQVRNSKWLVDTSNTPLCPADVINLPDITDEVTRLIAVEPGSFWQKGNLPKNIIQHSFFDQLEDRFFSKGEDGLEKIALLLEHNSDYAIGYIFIGSNDFTSLLNIMGNASYNQHFPGWRVVQSVSQYFGQEKCQQYVLTSVLKSLSNSKLIQLLEKLEQQHRGANEQKKQDIYICYLRYLEYLSRLENAHELLGQIKLLNQDGGWCLASELCSDAEGVAPSFLLDIQQRKSLTILLPKQENICWTESVDIDAVPYPKIPIKRNYEPDLYSTFNDLSVYFGQWEGLVPQEIICGFLSVLGSDLRMLQLAERFQGRHSVEWIRDKVPWKVQKQEDQDGRKGWLHGLNYFQALSKHRFIVELVSGREVSVTSIMGQTINVGLNDSFSSLIVGRPFYEWPEGETNYVRIRLRGVGDGQVTQDQFSKYLKASAEYLLKVVYVQKNIDLSSLWDELGKSEQLDVRIALRLVMKHIPFYLDQLGVHKHQLLKRAYNVWNEARYKTEEYRDVPEKFGKFQQDEENSREKLQYLILGDQKVQEAILESVRKKMRDFQYTEKNIPFELYQNADDAVVEQAEIESYPEVLTDLRDLPTTQINHFVVQEEGSKVRFMHWGRPVNSVGTGGFPGRERGFHQDLEKMLILSSSNKSSEKLLTGKFGLGFKSVLLVCDQPRFISGRLGVEIIAGLYPKELSGHQYLYQLLSQFSAENSKLGTLIELSLKDDSVNNVLGQFKELSGVLTVFSKKIRRIDFVESEQKHERVEWVPEKIMSTTDTLLEKGSLIFCNSKKKLLVDALHFRCLQGGGLLVGLGSRGFIPLPGELPPVWIVSPTREKGRLGFCINGDFEVDAGRARLAGESGKNIQEARRIGLSIGNALCALYEQSLENLPETCKQLRLVVDLTLYELWESVWSTLTRSWIEPSEKQLDSEVFDLVSNLLSSDTGLGMLIIEKHALPNGLWGKDFQRLIDPTSIRYVLRGSISEETVFKPLSMWRLFKDKIDPDSVISAKIFPALGKILPGFTQKKDQWQSLRLYQVIQWLKDSNYQIDQAGANILGGVITKDYFDKLPSTIDGEGELLEIKKEMKKLRFETCDDRWCESNLLLRSLSFGPSDDEPLRASFAPTQNILHSSYTGSALDLFILCRGEMRAGADTLAGWVLDAATDQKRIGALKYLIKGELGGQVATHLRFKGTEDSWLSDLSADSEYFEGWSEEDIKELLFRQLPSMSILERLGQENDFYEGKTPVIPPVDVSGTLLNIYKWWQTQQNDYLAKYETSTYPDRAFFSGLATDDRSSWLTVLMLGAFHTIGRARPEQHRSFLSLCQQKGWWDTFAKENPKNNSDKWMGVLEEYIDDQVSDSKFEYWMRLFPTIYKFARELDEYIELFYSLETQGKDVDVLQSMTPKSFSEFQGGGFIAAPVATTLGIGTTFVLREMMRKNMFNKNHENITPYCYVPLGRVRNLFSKMGCSGLENGDSSLVKSGAIYKFLCENIGKDKAHFNGSFDIPFQYVAEDLDLQKELFV